MYNENNILQDTIRCNYATGKCMISFIRIKQPDKCKINMCPFVFLGHRLSSKNIDFYKYDEVRIIKNI